MTDEADALCAYLPAVVRDGGVTERERKFVASLIHQRRRWPGRALSQAQIGWLRRIVRAFQDRTMRGEPCPGRAQNAAPTHWREDTDWQRLGDVVARLKGDVEAAIEARDESAGAAAHDDLISAEWRLRQAGRRRDG